METKNGDARGGGKNIQGFSKLTREQRINVIQNWLGENITRELNTFLHSDPGIQYVLSELSENYLSNYLLPMGVVPNVLINKRLYVVPVVTEESSVVAAASRAAKFWATHGGFHTSVLGTVKKGQIHFTWSGSASFLYSVFPDVKQRMLDSTLAITASMRERGGGITSVELKDKTNDIPGYFQVDVSFETAEAMGANFINSCLETMADTLQLSLVEYASEGKAEVIMSILSNYTPGSVVTCFVECPVEELKAMSGLLSPSDYVRRFSLAVHIANADISRAATHNKGIYNGVDAVMLATGNDWRAVEAAGHSYASVTGQYRSLSCIESDDKFFRYSLTIPVVAGTVGGLTRLHPLARTAMKILGNPSSVQLMEVAAAVGMANNFSAVTSLVTSGIQRGHMRMHLSNILNQLEAVGKKREEAEQYFSDKTVSYSAVEKFMSS